MSFVTSRAPGCGNDGVCHGANSSGCRGFASRPRLNSLEESCSLRAATAHVVPNNDEREALGITAHSQRNFDASLTSSRAAPQRPHSSTRLKGSRVTPAPPTLTRACFLDNKLTNSTSALILWEIFEAQNPTKRPISGSWPGTPKRGASSATAAAVCHEWRAPVTALPDGFISSVIKDECIFNEFSVKVGQTSVCSRAPCAAC